MRNWRQKPLQREYISELDRFLAQIDTLPSGTSASRRAEEAEYARISWLRDNPQETTKVRIWERF